VLAPEHWRALCLEVLGLPQLLEEERYATNEARVANRGDLEPRLERAFAARPAGEWIELLEGARIPCGRVNSVAEVMAHPQLAHNRLVAEVGSPVGSIPTIGVPFLVDGVRPEPGDVPALGQHTAEVLAELGFTPPG